LIVLDASAVTELLLETPAGQSVTEALAEAQDALVVPHLLDVEVVNALRNLASAMRWDLHRSQQYLERLALLPADRQSHVALLARVWELRHNFTAYDAVYIALAEALDAVLYTCDSKLRDGHRARVKVFRL